MGKIGAGTITIGGRGEDMPLYVVSLDGVTKSRYFDKVLGLAAMND